MRKHLAVIPIAILISAGMTSRAIAHRHTCFGRPATIVGSGSPDMIEGTAADDVIVGLGGDDYINAGTGADLVCGGAGDDHVMGTTMEDPSGAAVPDNHHDRFAGGPGDDDIQGEYGDDLLVGGRGHDVLEEWVDGDLSGNDRLVGGPGNDTLVGGDGIDEMHGGNGLDVIGFQTADGSGVTANLAGGHATGPDGAETFTTIEGAIGSPFRDDVKGSKGPNRYTPGGGEDVFYGRGGDDLYRESGKRVKGAGEIFFAGRGDDTFRAYPRTRVPVRADLRTGWIRGHGSDGTTGLENVTGTRGDDVLKGNDYPNVLVGKGGADLILGRSGRDRLSGAGRRGDVDTLDGGGDRDTCFKGERLESCEVTGRFPHPR